MYYRVRIDVMYMVGINFGLIGCGTMGTILARTLTGIGSGNIFSEVTGIENTRLVGVVDVREAIAKKTMKKFGVESYYLDYHDLLKRNDVNAVLVAVPHSLLAKIAVDSIKAGKHIFLEKPMAINSLEAKEVIEAAKRANIKLMIGYCLRFNPARIMMKKLIERGAIGETKLIIGGKGWARKEGERLWLVDATKGGGALLFIGVHLIDQVLWMVDSEVEEVFSQINIDPKYNVDETSVFNIRFKKGFLANLCCSSYLGRGVEGRFDFLEIAGSEGTIRADWNPYGDSILKVFSRTIKEYNNPTTIRIQEYPPVQMYQNELNQFTNSIINDRKPPITGEDGLRVLEIVDGIFKSAKTKSPVSFP